MRKLVLFCFCLLSLISLSAQVVVSGRVVNTRNEGIEFANVTLYALPDTILLKGTVTNHNGEFTLLVDDDDMPSFHKISYIGYESITTSTISEEPLVLHHNRYLLNEVTVKGNNKLYKSEKGIITATVKDTFLEYLPNTTEIIAQLPFLDSENGEFTVLGRGKPAIYINNRLISSSNELNQLSPSNINNIQIITMPGAQYDSSAQAVIKITTQKPVDEGLSGIVSVQGKRDNLFSGNELIALNYRMGAWDFLGSTSFVQNQSDFNVRISQRFKGPNNDRKQIFLSDKKGRYRNIAPQFGVNFNPNQTHSAGFQYMYDYTKDVASLDNNLEDIVGGLPRNAHQITDLNQPAHINKINAYYNGQFTDITSFNFNIDWLKGKNESNMVSHLLSAPQDLLRADSKRRYDLYAGKGVFSLKLGTGTLDVGGEYTFTRLTQKYDINKLHLGIDNTDDKEVQNRVATFVAYENKIGKWQFLGGLRFENIHMNYFDYNAKNVARCKRESNLLPNVTISYLGNKVQTYIGFERKVIYPTYNELRGSVQYTSPFLYESGNPLLKSKIENKFTGMFTWKRLQATARYSINENDILMFVEQYKDLPVAQFRPQNINKTRTANVSLSFAPSIGVWQPQWEIGSIWQWLNVESNGKTYQEPRISGKWINTFLLPHKWLFRISTTAQMGGHKGLVLLYPSWGFGLLLSKRLLKDKMTINLSASGLSKSRSVQWNMNYNNLIMNHAKNMYGRTIVLSIRYRLNSFKSKYKGQQTSDELKRLQPHN